MYESSFYFHFCFRSLLLLPGPLLLAHELTQAGGSCRLREIRPPQVLRFFRLWVLRRRTHRDELEIVCNVGAFIYLSWENEMQYLCIAPVVCLCFLGCE